MPRSFVDITFSSSGMIASMVVRRLHSLPHVRFISGDHDLYFDWNEPEEFDSKLKVIHDALAGTGATYRVHTRLEGSAWAKPIPWPPSVLETPEENPAFAQRSDPPKVERRD